jgi:hypothetical protein
MRFELGGLRFAQTAVAHRRKAAIAHPDAGGKIPPAGKKIPPARKKS